MNHTFCVGTEIEDLCRHINTRLSLIGPDTIRRATRALANEGDAPYDIADRDMLERVARWMGYKQMGASVSIVRKVAEALNARTEAQP